MEINELKKLSGIPIIENVEITPRPEAHEGWSGDALAYSVEEVDAYIAYLEDKIKKLSPKPKLPARYDSSWPVQQSIAPSNDVYRGDLE